MFEPSAFKLLSWIASHEKRPGEFLDNANHPIWGVENKHLLPHTFHYYGIIKGYLTLYQRLGDLQYLHKAEYAADYLCSLQKNNGQYSYDTFEFNTPSSSQGLTLIHNALPSSALLELYKETRNQLYLTTAKNNILWFYSRLWNGKYLTGCANQDVCAAEALLWLYTIEQKPVYKQRALQLADTYLQLQLKEGNLRGGFLRGFHEQHLVIPWYDAKTIHSYALMDDLLQTDRYAVPIQATLDFLQRTLSKQGLHHWYVKHKKNHWISVPEPHLIAPAGLVLDLFSRYHIKPSFDFRKHQQADGSFPPASWYTDYRKTPNLGWNQFMFLYLAQQVKKQIPLQPTSPSKSLFPEKKYLAFTGSIIGIHSQGYVDVIKDHFTLTSQQIHHKTFSISTDSPDAFEGVTLRFRMERGLLRFAKPLGKTLKVIIYPSFIKLPYLILEHLFTTLMKTVFYTKLFDWLAKLRVWKK